jgi:acetolactate synthase-1/2/3 large subunit
MTYTPPTGTTAAEDVLSRLKSAGVDVLLANGGTDFPSIIEAYANTAESGLDLPTVHTITHENVALGMAHGYYLATGKPAGVMVHVNVGLANAVMGLINAKSENIPVVMCSGRTPLTEGNRFGSRSSPIHWGQEMRDQAAMIREVVKWDYELRYPEQGGAIVDRAVSIAMSEPRGPVYLSLPREVLAEAKPLPPHRPGSNVAPTSYAAAHPDAVRAAAKALAGAKRPVIISQSPDHLAGFEPLAALAEKHAIPVVEYWSIRQALPTTHPMHAGREPTPWIKDADVIVALNAMVPWIPETVQPPEDCVIIALGPDPLHQAVPARGFPIDISLAGGITPTLQALSAALDEIATDTAHTERRARVAAFRQAAAEGVAKRVAAGQGRPMNPAYVSKCLSDAADDKTTFVNELGVDPSVMEFRAPNTLFGSPLSGGLGWGMAAALGVQLGAPDRQVIACVGDGSYLFANPVACHQTAASLGLPLLTVVFNNGIWNAVRRSTLYMYPEGKAAQANTMPITALNAMPDHAAIARAHGAHAERVEDGADLPAAIQRALAATKAGQQALLEVIVSY